MGYHLKRLLIVLVFLALCLDPYLLAKDTRFALGGNAGGLCVFIAGSGVYPYLGMNVQYNLAPRFILQIELDYYYNLLYSGSLIMPCFNLISISKRKNLDSYNTIPYLSFGIGIAKISRPTILPDLPDIFGFYKIGIGQKFRLFKNFFGNADISLNVPYLFLIPLIAGISPSLDLGFELRF